MKNHLPFRLVYPVLLVMLLDLTLTLFGQPVGYWRGVSGLVNEGSPLGFSLLNTGPLWFVLFLALYMAVAVFLLRALPVLLSLPLGLALFLGHAYGASSWLPVLYVRAGLPLLPFSDWYLIVGYFSLLSVVTTIIIYPLFSKYLKQPLS